MVTHHQEISTEVLALSLERDENLVMPVSEDEAKNELGLVLRLEKAH